MFTAGAACGAQVAAAIVTATTAGAALPPERSYTIAFAMAAVAGVLALAPAPAR